MLKLQSSIDTEVGLTARVAATFVQYTNKFICDIFIKYGDVVADGKSIMGILALGIASGGKVEISFNGVDEKAAYQAIAELLSDFDKKF